MTQELYNDTSQDSPETKPVRRSRSTDSRSFENRSANERAPLTYGLISRFNIQDKVNKKYKDLGYDICWIAYSVNNGETRENFFRHMDMGYEPILSAEEPDICRNYNISPFDDRNDRGENKLICRGGQALTKIKTEDRQNFLAQFDDENRRNDYITAMHQVAANNPSAPRPFIDERKRERVYG